MSETRAAYPVAPGLPCPIGDHPRRDLAVLLDMLWAVLCGLIALIISLFVQAGLATYGGSDVSWKLIGLRGLVAAAAAMLAASRRHPTRRRRRPTSSAAPTTSPPPARDSC
ncbi:hypothetical protein [Streptomyces violascens]|uniref:hypothetical protein n=1 Tax=Streptomyces violascens TaxID=67381 RepID=UPI0036CC3AF3